ncbi:hypothetical protein pdam_00022275 [Pocillopora damicornis]|uniref:Uncharacterized protein n=1 Tax=Pocillopora damicornis TaxID=46731 RepID=A0A3M6U0I1_POCDA|nr:hypothetical protein pdam_00022275 [Pocillopora damicornis]
MLFLYSTVVLNITFLKMGFIAVQWENENSLSVVSEEKVVGAVVLKEVTTVDISTGTNKGRVAIYKDTILEVCVSSIFLEIPENSQESLWRSAQSTPTAASETNALHALF